MTNRFAFVASRVSGVALAAAFVLSVHGHGSVATAPTDAHANLPGSHGDAVAPSEHASLVKAGFAPTIQHGTGER